MFQSKILPYFLLLSLFLSTNLSAQSLINKQAVAFQLIEETDTIDFIIADSSLTEKKPILLFCQGSLPIPLFADIPGHGPYLIGGGLTALPVSEIREKYHLVVISMPHTPLIAPQAQLDASYAYIPDTTRPKEYAEAFLRADYLENHVARASAVLDFIQDQAWVDTSRLVVTGHSQGARVAAGIPAERPEVTHLGLFGANPFGRLTEYVRKARQEAEQGRISWTNAGQQMEGYYDFLRKAQDPDSLQAYPHLTAWGSFSRPMLDTWLSLSCPIYLAYGTADPAAALCDLVPLFFIQEGKDHLTLERYPNLEHNFFETQENGRANYEHPHWKEVMNGFLDWIEHQ